MCIVTDEIVDPGNGEPGRDHISKMEKFVRNVKWGVGIVCIPLMVWMGRVEGFVQKGDRQTSLMSTQQHAEMVKNFDQRIDDLPPQVYRDFVASEFNRLHSRLDFIEGLLLAELTKE